MVDIQKSFRTLKMTQVLTLRWTTHWALAKDIDHRCDWQRRVVGSRRRCTVSRLEMLNFCIFVDIVYKYFIVYKICVVITYMP